MNREQPGSDPALTEMTQSAALTRPDGLALDTDPRPAVASGPWAALVRLRRIAGAVAVAAVALGLVAVWLWPGPPALMAASAGAALITALAASWALGRQQRPRLAQLARQFRQRLAADPDTLVFTDGTGGAVERPGDPADPPPEAWLDGWCAEPRRVVAQLLDELRRDGRAMREFRRHSSGLRLTVVPVSPPHWGLGDGQLLLWRFARAERLGRRGLDALGLPVLTLGVDGQPLSANPALIRMLDLPEGRDERSDPAAVLAQAAAPIRGAVAQALERGEAPVPLRLPGGQSAEAHPVMARDGLLDLLILPEGAGRLAGSGPPDYEDIPVALLQIDAQGRIEGSNRAARGLLGLAPAENRHLWEVVEGLGRPVADWLRDARTGRALNRPEVLRATCGGAETFVQIILRRPSDMAPPGTLLAVISDATELKSLEARFVQSQKMQAIGQLAGGIAHDFNNLLTAITGHCDLLLMGRDAFDPDHGDLQQIQQNANRAAALVRQLLAFSRKQTLQPEVFTIEAMLEDVVRLLTRLVGERISLDLRHDPRLRAIRADRRQLEQVIVNLVVNARDAMPMGGTIRIETEAVALEVERSIGRARLPAGQYSVIRVIDNGVGIPAELRDKIFEPFFTTKRQGEGTGLGLSTAYGIVKQMGGFIFVDSVVGSGTTFSMYFAADLSASPDVSAAPPPRAIAPAPAPTTPREGSRRPPVPVRPRRSEVAVPAPSGDPGATVLLVEDEAPVRAFAARALRLQGYRVLEAVDGESALEVVLERRESVDIIVTDVIMAGLDGPTWVARALEGRPGIPVVFVSGYIEDTLTEALGRTPHAVFLEKPFSLDALCRILAAQLTAAGHVIAPG